MDKLPKDVLFLLAMDMNLPSLIKFCLSSKRFNDLICQKTDIWLAKINKDYSDFKNKFENDPVYVQKTPKEKYEFLVLTKLKEGLNYEGDISELLKVKQLYIDSDISEIPKEIGVLINLESLYLGRNSIREIPKEIGDLKNLRNLYLDANKLTVIPKEIGNLKKLQYLDLYNNNISEIPKEIGDLKNLIYLDLASNKITKIPNEIANLVNLNTLQLSNNNITIYEIPVNLRKITRL